MPSQTPCMKVKESHAERMRKHRKNWTEEQRQKNREKTRERMRAYRKRKREQRTNGEKDSRVHIVTRQELKKEEERKKRNAEYRRQYRAKLSSQKKRRIREKDALRKTQKRAGNESERNLFTSNSCTSTPSASSESFSMPLKQYSASAFKKALYRAKKKLPNSPQKFAEVVKGLVEKASPRKKEALAGKGLTEDNRDYHIYTEAIREVDQSLRGRGKTARKMRKSFVGSLVKSLKKKYGTIKRVSQQLGIERKYLSSGCLKEDKRRKDCLNEDTEKSVKTFFAQDHISTSLPNKKLFKKGIEESRVLVNTVDATYRMWKEENPNKKISFDKFSKLKPKEVKTQKHRKFLQCLCEYCENSKLKLQEINKIAENCQKSELKMKSVQDSLELTLCEKTGKFHKLACVDRSCGNCGIEKLANDLKTGLPEEDQEWKKWVMQTTKNKRTGKDIKKKQITVIKGKTSDLIKEFTVEMEFLSRHLFQANWQLAQFAELRKHLPLNTVALTVDFAENYVCTSQNEIQAAYWAKESVTLHPTVAYYRCPDCQENDVVEEACDVVSDDLNHDSHAVHVFLHKIFSYLKEERGLDINKAFIMSDGCAAQYKSKIPFADAANSFTEFGFTIQRDYYGSRHGKNRCDGEGGVLKARITRAVKNNEAVIDSALSFYNFCKEHLEKGPDVEGKCIHKRRHLFYVSTDDIRRPRPERNVKTIAGTQKMHSVIGVDRDMLKTRRLSCFCQECLTESPENCVNKSYVDEWKPVHLKYVQPPALQHDMAQPLDDDNMAQPLDDDNMAQPLDDDNMAQPLDDDNMAQPLDDDNMAQPLDDDNLAQPLDAYFDRNISVADSDSDCAEDSDFKNISGLSAIIAALERDDDDSLSPVFTFDPDTNEQITEDPRESTTDPKVESYNPGQYILVAHGSCSLPAVVQEWPFVQFYTSCKDKKGWTEGHIPHTVLLEDVIRTLQPPDIRIHGSRIFYLFPDF